MSDTVDPRSTALVVMDYQNAIVEMVGDASDALVARAVEAIATVRDRGAQVVYVWVAFDDDDFEAVPSRASMARIAAAGRKFHVDSPEMAIDERIAPQAGDIVVRKTRVGSFSTTDLHEQLQERGIETLILAGISTSGCVLSTVRDAADRDYRVYVLADGCADPQPGVHEFLTEKIFPRQAQLATVSELGELLTEQPSASTHT